MAKNTKLHRADRKGQNETQVFYFTGTGNSLSIARDIGSEFARAELLSMPKLIRSDKEIVIAGDIIGFVFPVYFARPPAFVAVIPQDAAGIAYQAFVDSRTNEVAGTVAWPFLFKAF